MGYGPPPHIATRTGLPELSLLLDEKIGRERGNSSGHFLAPEPVGGRKCSLQWGDTYPKGWMLMNIECWHQIDALHSLCPLVTEADLSPRARLIWG